ncbi:MAG: LPXTG cell wall anchor domain-containing protein [Aeromicrobium sp.]
MTTLRLAVAAVLTCILVLSTGSLAHAAADPYPVATPVPTQSVAPDDDAVAPDDDAVAPDDDGILPSTGGVGFYLLIVGGALVVAGGGAVHASRRRHVISH